MDFPLYVVPVNHPAWFWMPFILAEEQVAGEDATDRPLPFPVGVVDLDDVRLWTYGSFRHWLHLSPFGHPSHFGSSGLHLAHTGTQRSPPPMQPVAYTIRLSSLVPQVMQAMT